MLFFARIQRIRVTAKRLSICLFDTKPRTMHATPFTTATRMITSHPALQPILPDLQTVMLKMLESSHHGSPPSHASTSERRAWAIFSRVGEVDNCLRSLRIAIAGIEVQSNAPAPDPEQFRYHVENYLLRFTGLYDRACRLAGIALGMRDQDVDRLQGNAAVLATLKKRAAEAAKVLAEIKGLVAPYKNGRNQVAHAAEFSDRSLGLFAAASRSKLDGVDPTAIAQLMAANFRETGLEVVQVTDAAESLLNRLLDCLAKAKGSLLQPTDAVDQFECVRVVRSAAGECDEHFS